MLLAAAIALVGVTVPKTLDSYDVVWKTPSSNAAGSMPIGNGEVVLNAWVEGATGDLLFLIGRSDSLSEISQLLKIGRVRVKLSPNPFQGKDFEHRLILRDGIMRFAGSGDKLELFVDPAADVVHLKGTFATPRKVQATVECWRNAPRTLPDSENVSAWSVRDAPFPRVESADIFLPAKDSVSWYHRNETSVVPKLWENQSLTGLPGTFDPLIHRTFGGRLEGTGLHADGRTLTASEPQSTIDLKLTTACQQTPTVEDWITKLNNETTKSPTPQAHDRNKAWWNAFWGRSWVFVNGDTSSKTIPENKDPIRIGVDSNGQNKFKGTIENPISEVSAKRLHLEADIESASTEPGRIIDHLTAGQSDGFLFDTHPGDSLRLIVGDLTLNVPGVLKPGAKHHVEANYDAATGAASILLDGKVVAAKQPESGSMVTRGYLLQRYVQACQGRGNLPVKFNGGTYSVEPTAMGRGSNPDYRSWGDSYWFQNTRHMFHPLMASGDIEMTVPLFRLYESVVPLAESRTKTYHNASGVYFPETMTAYGTYSGGDYGWNREGLLPKDVQCPYWQYAWNQGPELVALMLDRYDYTGDKTFLNKELLPMADAVLRYFDTRFKKDSKGRVILDPAQSVETYWQGVVNDTPTVAGLINITHRLCKLPTSAKQKAFFEKMRNACPELPVANGKITPAQQYVDQTSNCENPELYAVWPFRLSSLSHPELLAEGRKAYAERRNHLDVGWGYDGNAAALLGLTDEAARILSVKARNSHPAYRWPATWGPNFDWLPDQNHGGNLLTTTNLMLLQCDAMDEGGAIRLLPAWPKAWDVDFKLHAPGNTTVHCVYNAGKVKTLEVTPESRRKDIVMPQ